MTAFLSLTLQDQQKAVIGIFTANFFIHNEYKTADAPYHEQKATENFLKHYCYLKWYQNRLRLPFAYFQRDNEKHLVAITYLFHFTIYKAVCSSCLFSFSLWVEHTTFKLDSVFTALGKYMLQSKWLVLPIKKWGTWLFLSVMSDQIC